MDKILILGGTGAIGTYLVQILSASYEVYVTSRSKKNNNGNIKYIQGNAHNIEFIKRLLFNNHYKAIVDFMNYSTIEFQNRVGFLLGATEQLFYVSSSRVYADSQPPIMETNARLLDVSTDKHFLKTDDYTLAKARQENILRNSGDNWTIIRPYMSYSPNRLDLGYYAKELWLYRVLKGRTILFTEDVAKSLTTLTHGMDVARGIASLIGVSDSIGEVYHITQEKAYLWRDILAVYKEALETWDIKVKVKMMPKALIADEYIYCYDRIYDRSFDNSKIKHYLSTDDFVDALDGIKQSVEQFLKSPRFLRIDWKKQAYWDCITKEKADLSEIDNTKDKFVYIAFRYLISYRWIHNIYQKIK